MRRALGLCALLSVCLSLDSAAEGQGFDFRSCWEEVERTRSGSRSMECLRGAPDDTRTAGHFACYEAIAFALSHSQVAAAYRYEACGRHFAAIEREVPSRISRLYESATVVARRVRIGNQSFYLIPEQTGGVSAGHCAPGASCPPATGVPWPGGVQGPPVQLPGTGL